MTQTSVHKSVYPAWLQAVWEFILSNAVHTHKLKFIFSFFIGIFINFSSFAQDSSVNKIQSVNPGRTDVQPGGQLTKNQINKRVKIAAAANIVVYSTSMIALYSTWYKDYPQSNFHVFKDFDEWQRMDKIGHAYSAYTIGKLSMELWRWTGIERKKRIWIGGLSGAFYQTVIEVLDGFSAEWGWSWGDFGANIVGSGMLIAQELAWDEQRIQFKFSTHLKNYSDPSLDQRSDEIFGESTAERFLKDYNGQTYWLSTNIRSFFPKSKWPVWLQVSVGTGAEGMFGATENIGKDENGNVNFNRTDIKRYRQWYLAPDIDLSKIKTNKKGIKFALTLLNVIKFPMPALEYSNGSFKIKAIAF